MSKKLRIGVIGAGRIGKLLLRKPTSAQCFAKSCCRGFVLHIRSILSPLEYSTKIGILKDSVVKCSTCA